MHIYLVRHAHAVDGENDAVRPLSEKGRAQIRKVGRQLREAKAVQVKEIWHSPLVRSRDSAARLAKRLKVKARLCLKSGMKPEDEPEVIARHLDEVRQPVMVVGHEPHLSTLATYLVTGKLGRPLFHLKKCAVLRLDREGERWTVRWLVSPEVG